MPVKKYSVALTAVEKARLEQIATSNKRSARERVRARILLLSDRRYGPAMSDFAISQEVSTSGNTVTRVRQRFAEGGLDRALFHKEQERRKPRVLDGEAEAKLIALTCSVPPEGRQRWSLVLLKERLIEMRVVDCVSHETIRQTLKKTNSNPG